MSGATWGHIAQSGAARMPMMAGLSIVAILAASLGAFSGCHSSAGQITLKTGQCVLDSGVEAILLVDLVDKNYAQLVSDAVTKFGPTLVTCALQAIASTAPAATGSAAVTGQIDPRVIRAREMLGKLGAAK